MMGLADRFKNNAPASKPELWSDLPRALRRRAAVVLHRRLDPAWWDRPCIATLAPDDGVLMEVRPNEKIGRAILYYGVYEYAPTQLVRAFLQPGDTFFDVGANLGYYSLVAAKLVGPAGKVVGFEPVPHVRDRFARNVSLNGFTNVEIRAEVVASGEGTIAFHEIVEGNDYGSSSAVHRPANSRTVTHPTIALDTIVRETGVHPQLMKVDVEGGEAAVFAGAHELLSRDDAPCLLFETFDPARELETVRGFGYRVFVPSLDARGRVGLASADRDRGSYRAWEAPNFFAVKGARGEAFVRRFAR